MYPQCIEFDIKTLRGDNFPDVLALIAASSLKHRSASVTREDISSQAEFPNPNAGMVKQELASVEGLKEKPHDFFGFGIPQDRLTTAQSKLDSMQGLAASVRIEGPRFKELAERWMRNQDRLAERDFRVYCGVLSRFEEGQKFASIRRDDIRLGAFGFASKQDHENFGMGHSLLTDMQIRVTLDELQSRGLFTSVVYGKRHRYFSTGLTQAELAEEVLRFHAERNNRKAFNIPSIRGPKKN